MIGFSKNATYKVPLAIGGGYVPEKCGSTNTKTTMLGLNLSNFP